MEKIALLIALLITITNANSTLLEKNCLVCHQKEQIPNQLIYKRYILKYSTQKNIQKAIYSYLKEPLQSKSIMPSAFFSKFSMKKKSHLEPLLLKKTIQAYAKKFDMRKRLRLKKF